MDEKRKVSIKLKLLAASLLPLVLVTVIISIYALYSMRKAIQDEALQGLRDMCYTVATAYDNMAEGDYILEGDHIKKGGFDITANEDLLDKFVANSEADVTFFYGDVRRATSLLDAKTGERIIGTKASEAVVETTLKGGEDFSSTDVEINGQGYYAYYIPLKSADGSIVGMVFAGKPTAEVSKVIVSHTTAIVIMAIVFAIIAAVVVFFIVGRLCNVIVRTGVLLTKLSDGDLTVDIDSGITARKDEIGVMARSLQNLLNQLKKVLGEIKDLSGVLSDSSKDLKNFAVNTNRTTDEISRAVDDMSQGSSSQAEDVESATLQVSDMGSAIEKMVEEIGTLYSNSEKMEHSKNDAEKIVNELAASSDHTFEAVKRIETQVKLTDDSVTQIQQAVALITSIAEETNLLSLNASIEAARAGEAGKGFAVVASQIQKLAEESNSSAASIADVIESLSQESKNTVVAMNNMNDIIVDQQQKLGSTEAKFSEVSAGIQSSLEQIDEIRGDSEICDEARIKVTDIIQNLSAISEQNAAATEQTNASMQELNSTMSVLAEKSEQLGELAVQLDQDLDFFKL